MSGVAIGLVLGAAALHAGWNRLLHDTGDRLAAVAAGAIVGSVLLVPGMVTWPPFRAWAFILPSGAAEALYAWFLTAAYRRGELSFTYPVARGTAPFLATVGGALLLAEPLDAARVAGSLALGAGLATIARAGGRRGRGPAIAFAAATGLVIATYSVIDARAVRSVAPVGYLGAVTVVQACILLAALRFDWRRVRAAAVPGLGVGVGSIAAYLLVLFAFTRAPVGPVATLRELSILVGVLIARERVGRPVWLGAALCVAGAALVVV